MCFDKSKKNPEKWVAGLGLPLVERIKPPEPPGCLILEGLQTPHPHKQETRGLDTTQATSFFPWWLLLFFKNTLRQRVICKNHEIRKNAEKSQACECVSQTLHT